MALDPAAALTELRRSIALETAAGLAVLMFVALLGVQPPPVST